jgi:hypothetical protein
MILRGLSAALVVAVCFSINIVAQTTAFTYQGSLRSSGTPANGNYDLEIKLFDAVSGGTQQGSTVQKLNVPVTNGIFTVSLDFGAAVLPGADRFLDIAVRASGGGAFTPLMPRQQVNSAPYSVKSLNSASADSVSSATGIPAGSGNYIQNQNAGPQASSNFNISGNGTAGGTLTGNAVTSGTQYNIGANRVLSSPIGDFNLFVGVSAGSPNVTGTKNTFVGNAAGLFNNTGTSNTAIGTSAGLQNNSGSQNTFVGTFAGNATTVGDDTFVGYGAGAFTSTGSYNAFFGSSAGYNVTTGFGNSFFGYHTGLSTNTGCCNAFFGSGSGLNNTTGANNAFFGTDNGQGNTTGFQNVFVGNFAGNNNGAGSRITTIGNASDVLANNLTNASAIGANAVVGASNAMVLGSINGVNGATANTNVGIGTTTPLSALHIQDGGTNAAHVRIGGNVAGTDEKIITFGDWGCGGGAPCVYIGERAVDDRLEFRAGSFVFVVGTIQAAVLGSGGSLSLCRNASNEISTCSSSLRYKTNIREFASGLSFVNKLRPISFDWKDGGMKDIGFGAEDIAKVDPRFVTYNNKGEVEGVKYDRLSAAFVNAFKEQQQQIEDQRKKIETLTSALCSLKADLDVCKQK